MRRVERDGLGLLIEIGKTDKRSAGQLGFPTVYPQLARIDDTVAIAGCLGHPQISFAFPFGYSDTSRERTAHDDGGRILCATILRPDEKRLLQRIDGIGQMNADASCNLLTVQAPPFAGLFQGVGHRTVLVDIDVAGRDAQ